MMMRGHFYGSILSLAVFLISLSCTIHAESRTCGYEPPQESCHCDSNEVPSTHTTPDADSYEVPTFTMRDANENYRLQRDVELGVSPMAAPPSFCTDNICPGLGQGFYLPNVNAISALFAGIPILKETELGKCARYFPLSQGTSHFTFTRTTENLLNSLGTETGVSGSVSSKKLSFSSTVSVATKHSVEQSSNIMSSVMEKKVISGEIRQLQTSECMGQDSLDERFLSALEGLTIVVGNPAFEAAWRPYLLFLRQYGSHVITGQMLGSKFQRWDSIISTSSNMQRSLQARACAEIEGVKPGGGWSVESCSTFTEKEKRDSLQVDARSTVNIVGGKAGPRRALIARVTEETLSNFIKSSGSAEEPISNLFTPIWDVITSRLGKVPDMLQRAINLRTAYEGWTAFQCPKLTTSNGIVYQEFRLMDRSHGRNLYGCWNKKVACNTNDDCKLGGARTVCYCEGQSCIEERDHRSAVRTKRQGSYNEGVNIPCYYKTAFRCHCNAEGTAGGPTDRYIWS